MGEVPQLRRLVAGHRYDLAPTSRNPGDVKDGVVVSLEVGQDGFAAAGGRVLKHEAGNRLSLERCCASERNFLGRKSYSEHG